MAPEFTLQLALLLLLFGVDEKFQFQWQKVKQHNLAWTESSVLSLGIPISFFPYT